MHSSFPKYIFSLCSSYSDLSNEALEARICKNEIRPKIPKDCLPSLAKLMEDCWHDNPEKVASPSSLLPLPLFTFFCSAHQRPDFEQINSRLDTILVELAIADRHGRAFWSEHFLKEVRGSVYAFLFKKKNSSPSHPRPV